MSEATLFFLLLLVSLLSQSFSCFNPRNKNTTTTATTRFVTLHNQIHLTPSLCYLKFSLSSQPWPNPWAPPPFLVVVLTCATTITSNHWPPLFLFAFIATFPSSVFGCIYYLGCFGDWVQFGMWKSFDNLAWVWNLGHLSGCFVDLGKKESTKPSWKYW